MNSKTWFFGITFFTFAILLYGCERQSGEQPEHQQKPLVYMITPMSHPSLELAINGFREGLAQSGWGENKVQLEYANANGEFDKIPNLVKRAIGEGAKLVYVLTTPAASVAIKHTDPARVPLVYSAVTDPVRAKIVSDMSRSSTYATGISDRYPVEEQVRFFRKISPSMKSAGLLYNPAEENSQVLVQQTITALERAGLSGKRYTTPTETEIAQVARRAFAENDAVIVNGDNLVTDNLPTVINIAVEVKKPLFVGDPDSVRRGALATVGPSYLVMGKQAGQKAAEVLKGKDVRQIPSAFPSSFDYIINVQAAQAMGMDIPHGAWSARPIWESTAKATGS